MGRRGLERKTRALGFCPNSEPLDRPARANAAVVSTAQNVASVSEWKQSCDAASTD